MSLPVPLPVPAVPAIPSRRALGAGVVAFVAFALSGWRGLLVPSLIRSIESAFVQTDAAMGAYFFGAAAVYAAGTFLAGACLRTLGFRTTLVLAGLGISAGLVVQGAAATWELFVVGVVPIMLGAALIDVGVNALILDLFPEARGRALNLLHLAYSLAALTAPVAVAALVIGVVPWQAVVTGTGVAWLAMAVAFGIAIPPEAGVAGTPGVGAGERGPVPGARRLMRPPPVLVMLAIAIACYVAAEAGLSDWMLRFLEDLPVELASIALTLFWAGITVGRLGFARVGDRLDPVAAAAACSIAGALLVVGAVLAPGAELSLVAFGAAGIAFGPVYPLVVAAAGASLPGRSALVASTLSFAAVVGAVSYPPAVGLMSVTVGLPVAMLGTAGLVLGCGVALVAVRRMAER